MPLARFADDPRGPDAFVMPDCVTSEATRRARRAAAARWAGGRRRKVDPTTCQHDYSIIEIEFLAAIEEYKRSSGRKFPTWVEVLEVLQGLGYRKD